PTLFMSPLTTRLWCTALLLLTIPTIPTPIPATCPEQLWRGERELRWAPPLGVLGVATGAIAIGTAATSTSTTTIISIATTISTATSAARDKVIGSTIRNTVEMRLTGTGKRRTNSAVRALVERVIALVVAALERVPVPAEAVLQVAALEHVPVEAALERVLVVAALERVLVVAVPGLVPVAAVLELVPVVAKLEHVLAVA